MNWKMIYLLFQMNIKKITAKTADIGLLSSFFNFIYSKQKIKI